MYYFIFHCKTRKKKSNNFFANFGINFGINFKYVHLGRANVILNSILINFFFPFFLSFVYTEYGTILQGLIFLRNEKYLIYSNMVCWHLISTSILLPNSSMISKMILYRISHNISRRLLNNC